MNININPQENKYKGIETLYNLSKVNGYITLNDIENIFNVSREDAQILLNGFWKGGLLYKLNSLNPNNPKALRFYFTHNYINYLGDVKK